MSKYVGIIVGSALLATGIGAALGVPMFTTWFTTFAFAAKSALIASGSSLLISGTGTLLTTKTQLGGVGTASRNPIATWNDIYGRAKIGGILVWTGTVA